MFDHSRLMRSLPKTNTCSELLQYKIQVASEGVEETNVLESKKRD